MAVRYQNCVMHMVCKLHIDNAVLTMSSQKYAIEIVGLLYCYVILCYVIKKIFKYEQYSSKLAMSVWISSTYRSHLGK